MSEMPEALVNTAKIIKNRYKAVPIEAIIGMLITKVAHTLSSKRIMYQEQKIQACLIFTILYFYHRDMVKTEL